MSAECFWTRLSDLHMKRFDVLSSAAIHQNQLAFLQNICSWLDLVHGVTSWWALMWTFISLDVSFIGLMCLVRFLLSVLISDRMRTCLVLPRQIKQLQFINLVLLLVSFSALIQLFYWTKVLIPLISILIWKNIWPFVWSSQDQSHKFCNINLYDHGLNEILNPWISMWSQSMDSDCISPIKGRKLESAYAYWIFFIQDLHLNILFV